MTSLLKYTVFVGFYISYFSLLFTMPNKECKKIMITTLFRNLFPRKYTGFPGVESNKQTNKKKNVITASE